MNTKLSQWHRETYADALQRNPTESPSSSSASSAGEASIDDSHSERKEIGMRPRKASKGMGSKTKRTLRSLGAKVAGFLENHASSQQYQRYIRERK